MPTSGYCLKNCLVNIPIVCWWPAHNRALFSYALSLPFPYRGRGVILFHSWQWMCPLGPFSYHRPMTRSIKYTPATLTHPTDIGFSLSENWMQIRRSIDFLPSPLPFSSIITPHDWSFSFFSLSEAQTIVYTFLAERIPEFLKEDDKTVASSERVLYADLLLVSGRDSKV